MTAKEKGDLKQLLYATSERRKRAVVTPTPFNTPQNSYKEHSNLPATLLLPNLILPVYNTQDSKNKKDNLKENNLHFNFNLNNFDNKNDNNKNNKKNENENVIENSVPPLLPSLPLLPMLPLTRSLTVSAILNPEFILKADDCDYLSKTEELQEKEKEKEQNNKNEELKENVQEKEKWVDEQVKKELRKICDQWQYKVDPKSADFFFEKSESNKNIEKNLEQQQKQKRIENCTSLKAGFQPKDGSCCPICLSGDEDIGFEHLGWVTHQKMRKVTNNKSYICKGSFHYSCISKSLQNDPRCPLCRQLIL